MDEEYIGEYEEFLVFEGLGRAPMSSEWEDPDEFECYDN